MSKFLEPGAYLPHRPPMMFVGKVVNIDEDSVSCESDTAAGGPFDIALNEDGSLDNYFMYEFLAQTVGVWAGYFREIENCKNEEDGGARGEKLADIGMLLSIRSGKLRAGRIAPNSLLCATMRKLFRDGQVATFEGSVHCKGEELATARVTVFQPKVNELSTFFTKKND